MFTKLTTDRVCAVYRASYSVHETFLKCFPQKLGTICARHSYVFYICNIRMYICKMETNCFGTLSTGSRDIAGDRTSLRNGYVHNLEWTTLGCWSQMAQYNDEQIKLLYVHHTWTVQWRNHHTWSTSASRVKRSLVQWASWRHYTRTQKQYLCSPFGTSRVCCWTEFRNLILAWTPWLQRTAT